jgi:TPR repeat protein
VKDRPKILHLMAPSSEPFRTMRRISIVLREAVPTIQRQRRGGGSISVSRKPLSYYTSSSLLSQNQQYFNSIHNHERLQALSMATPSTQFCRYFSSNDKSADSISAGEDLYRQAIEAMEMATKVQEERQEEQSQKMYEAWQKTQDAETKNPKTQGVVVVKTLVKHVNKQRKAALDNDIQFKQKARDLLEQAAALEHPLSLVQLGNLALEDAKREQQSDRQLAHVSKAMSYFRRAGEAGNRVGWYNLGQLLWTGYPTFEEEDDPVEGVERILEPDMHEAMEAFTHAMDLGDADAMYLGMSRVVGCRNLK